VVNELRELYRYRELIKNLVARDLKIRYKNSILGFFWSFANPVLQVFMYWFLFKVVLSIGFDNYSAYVFCAFVAWNYLQLAILDASSSVRVQHSLMRRVRFPREALPISLVLSNLVHFLLALLVLFAFLLSLPVIPRLVWLWLPAVIIVQTAFTMGISLIVACLNVFYEDIKYIVAALMNVLFLVSPVIYVVEQVMHSRLLFLGSFGPVFKRLYMLNPAAIMIHAYRQILLGAPPPSAGLGVYRMSPGLIASGVVLSFAVLLFGYWLFNRYKWMFVERA
jgi:lipopolysaccharide transport system permease protein